MNLSADFFKLILGFSKEISPQISFAGLLTRLKLIVLGLKHKKDLLAFFERINPLGIGMTAEMFGVISWPYIHNKWNVRTKLNAIASHYELISKLQPKLVDVKKEINLINFDDISDGVNVCIDKPGWFIREGELVINIFKHDLRVVSIAFVLGKQEQGLAAYIGAVQGIHQGVSKEDSLAIFKSLTKDFYGLRPKTLLLEILKTTVKEMGIDRLYGITDTHRHHRHAYFQYNKKIKINSDYDKFWEEQGGLLDKQSGFYMLSTSPSIKDLAAVPSKKRSLYRRRNMFIESLSDRIK